MTCPAIELPIQFCLRVCNILNGDVPDVDTGFRPKVVPAASSGVDIRAPHGGELESRSMPPLLTYRAVCRLSRSSSDTSPPSTSSTRPPAISA